MFTIDGKCCVSLEIISSLEKRFYVITKLDERNTVFGVKVDFIEEIYPILSGKFIDRMNTYTNQAPIIKDTSCGGSGTLVSRVSGTPLLYYWVPYHYWGIKF